jgi:hypothetical protein
VNFDTAQSSVPDEYELHINTAGVVEAVAALRRFFIIADGSIGLGPPDMRVGDEVWILAGGNLPLILRRSKDSFGHLIRAGLSHATRSSEIAISMA